MNLKTRLLGFAALLVLLSSVASWLVFQHIAEGIIEQTQLDFNERTPDTVPEDFNWARLIYQDMFA